MCFIFVGTSGGLVPSFYMDLVRFKYLTYSLLTQTRTINYIDYRLLIFFCHKVEVDWVKMDQKHFSHNK